MSVTYSFSPNTRIKSAEVNQDFTDCVSPYTSFTTWAVTPISGVSWASQEGLFARIGNLVFYHVCLYGVQTGSGDAVTFELNLPVTGIAATFQRSVGMGFWLSGAATVRINRAQISSADVGRINFVRDDNGTLTASNVGAYASAQFYANGFYRWA